MSRSTANGLALPAFSYSAFSGNVDSPTHAGPESNTADLDEDLFGEAGASIEDAALNEELFGEDGEVTQDSSSYEPISTALEEKAADSDLASTQKKAAQTGATTKGGAEDCNSTAFNPTPKHVPTGSGYGHGGGTDIIRPVAIPAVPAKEKSDAKMSREEERRMKNERRAEALKSGKYKALSGKPTLIISDKTNKNAAVQRPDSTKKTEEDQDEKGERRVKAPGAAEPKKKVAEAPKTISTNVKASTTQQKRKRSGDDEEQSDVSTKKTRTKKEVEIEQQQTPAEAYGNFTKTNVARASQQKRKRSEDDADQPKVPAKRTRATAGIDDEVKPAPSSKAGSVASTSPGKKASQKLKRTGDDGEQSTADTGSTQSKKRVASTQKPTPKPSDTEATTASPTKASLQKRKRAGDDEEQSTGLIKRKKTEVEVASEKKQALEAVNSSVGQPSSTGVAPTKQEYRNKAKDAASTSTAQKPSDAEATAEQKRVEGNTAPSKTSEKRKRGEDDAEDEISVPSKRTCVEDGAPPKIINESKLSTDDVYSDDDDEAGEGEEEEEDEFTRMLKEELAKDETEVVGEQISRPRAHASKKVEEKEDPIVANILTPLRNSEKIRVVEYLNSKYARGMKPLTINQLVVFVSHRLKNGGGMVQQKEDFDADEEKPFEDTSDQLILDDETAAREAAIDPSKRPTLVLGKSTKKQATSTATKAVTGKDKTPTPATSPLAASPMTADYAELDAAIASATTKEPEATSTTAVADPRRAQYARMTKDELKAVFKDRGLTKPNLRAKQIDKLVNWDEAKAKGESLEGFAKLAPKSTPKKDDGEGKDGGDGMETRKLGVADLEYWLSMK